MQQIMSEVSLTPTPNRPKNYIRGKFFQVVTSDAFEYTISFCVAVNMLCLCFEYYGSP